MRASCARVRDRGTLVLSADALDLASLNKALSTARRELGSLDAVVNAVSAARPPGSGPFGGAVGGCGPRGVSGMDRGGRSEERRVGNECRSGGLAKYVREQQ